MDLSQTGACVENVQARQIGVEKPYRTKRDMTAALGLEPKGRYTLAFVDGTNMLHIQQQEQRAA